MSDEHKAFFVRLGMSPSEADAYTKEVIINVRVEQVWRQYGEWMMGYVVGRMADEGRLPASGNG